MTLASNITDNLPVLAAPRPVRLVISSPQQRFRPKPAQSQSESALSQDFRPSLRPESPIDRDLPPASLSSAPSPRASPRAALPTEALEEFLSILRPSFFRPSSPLSRRYPTTSMATFSQERGPLMLKSRPRVEGPLDDLDRVRSAQASRSSGVESLDYQVPSSIGSADFDLPFESPQLKWYPSNVLSSPISRTNTRNPFLRYLQDQSPVSRVTTLSPTSIPLPLPSPNELLET